MKITILENDKNELDYLKSKIEGWSRKTGTVIEISEFESGEAYFSKRVSSSEESTVVFLDIQMGKMSGIDVAEQLRKENYKGFILFLTAFREYVFRGYDVHALNYLLKPVQEKVLEACLDEIASESSKQSYLFRVGHDTFLIPYADIISITSSGHNVDILTTTKCHSQYTSLNNIITYLPKEFIRVHRGHIVNLSHIRKVSGQTITLSNRTTLQIGRNYYKEFIKSFSDYSSRFERR